MPDVHGSARFANYAGDPAAGVLNGRNLIYGRPMNDDRERLCGQTPSRHFLSIAGTRSGKGVSLITPNLLTWMGSVVVIDPKGENAWLTAERRRKAGQKVHILDPWGEVQRRYADLADVEEPGASYNPLSILDPAGEHYADDVAYLADALIINEGSDPHWSNSARELVAGLIAYTIESPALRDHASPGLVRQLLCRSSDGIKAIALDAEQLGPDSLAAAKLARFGGELGREADSIISTARTQTAFLDSSALQKHMAASDVSFDDLLTGKTTIYIVLPVDKLQTYGRWLRLLISIAIRTVARSAAPLPQSVLFLLDEFGSIGRLNAVAQAYGLMAGLGMTLWAFVQDLNQLKRDYPDEWETFIANSQAITAFGVMDQFTCEYLSRMMGDTTIEHISVATAKAREGGILKSGDPNFSRMDDKLFSRALMMPEEIRKLIGTGGVMLWRGDPVLFARIIYHQDPLFAPHARPDPRYGATSESVRAAVAAKAIPDAARAKAKLEAAGYVIKWGMFSSKPDVRGPDGKPVPLTDDASLIAHARDVMVKSM